MSGGFHFQQIFMLARTYHESIHEVCSINKTVLKNFTKVRKISESESFSKTRFFVEHLRVSDTRIASDKDSD